MNSQVALAVFAALLLVLVQFRHGRNSSPVAYFSAFAAFFLLGPLANVAVGNTIFAGTDVSATEEVAIWYFLAFLGLTVGDFLIWRKARTEIVPRFIPRNVAPIILYASGAYGIAMTLLVGINAVSKRAGLESVGGFHYRYLIIEAVLVGSYWFFKERRACLLAFRFNALAYTLYCLSFRERDFVFVAFAVVVLGVLLGKMRFRWGVIAGLGGVIVGSALFVSRADKELTIANVLNQGSNLFVDTYLANLNPITSEPLRSTYIRLATGRQPTEQGGTAVWFKSLYAPDGSSGYGFSLVGEARYNVGIVGIVLVFALLAGLLIASFSNASYWDLRITGPATLYTLLYALRGDMRAVIVSILYIAVIHLIVAARSTSTVQRDPLRDSRTRFRKVPHSSDPRRSGQLEM